MAVSSVHIELDRFFFATKDVTPDNCWEWFRSFRDTLLYKEYEQNPNPYAMELLDETDSYSAYCAVVNIEGRVVAELERKGEEVTFEKVRDICVQKKGRDYIELKEREARYIELHPNASRWNGSERKGQKKQKAEPEPANGQGDEPEPPAEPEPKAEPKPPADPRKVKKPRGEFGKVRLSDEEEDTLITRFGPEKTRAYIDKVDAYIAANGKRYKDHYATILNWIRRDDEKAQAEATPKRRYMTQEEISAQNYQIAMEQGRKMAEERAAKEKAEKEARAREQKAVRDEIARRKAARGDKLVPLDQIKVAGY